MNIKQPLVFTVGDLVVLVRSRTHTQIGDLHIIESVVSNSVGLRYTTTGGAWYTRNDFELVEESSEELLDILFAGIPEDEEDLDSDDAEVDGVYENHAEWRDSDEPEPHIDEYDL